MAKETIYYKPQIGRATKDVLRELTLEDQNYIKKVMDCYRQLAELDTRPEFKQWFNSENHHLPRQPLNNNRHNSARSFCDGIIDKLNQAPNRRDLSPKQCDGIETLSQHIAACYDQGLCPTIEFKNKMEKSVAAIPQSFNRIFKQ